MDKHALPNRVPVGRCVMIIAGEASGDLHGANLIRNMREQIKDPLFFCGIGGAAMRRAGAKILVEAERLSVVGITEVIARMPDILSGMKTAKRMLASRIPDLLVLIDFPDFNLRMAATAKKHGIPVFYYISPQVWAWRKGRVRTIRKRVDHTAVILPFEADFFKAHDVPVTFVGHPLLDAGYGPAPLYERTEGRTVVGLLPGSRGSEVARHLPVMMEAGARISRRHPHVTFMVSCAHSIPVESMASITEKYIGTVPFTIVPGDVTQVLKRSTCVVAVSGTVSLETALYGVPMVVIYKVSFLSYWLAKALIRLEHISLVNLIAGKAVVPELIQKDASAEHIAARIMSMISDPQELETVRKELAEVRKRLGGPGASARAAGIAARLLNEGVT
ncbi:lipid-A-disaccharide synthase [Desulfosudis oleivorans]|uniref:Lipid-A-disaccharide synthase n=1 Tax=Desulfosudis oleivorans (strain DSM 6200 / JCM 39069 / Hxd3) TaxID=96561 RepID=A8ZY13_DESOH|nr:lipid-A-disaccharide synthase [Desulfosudis oleivorans]ABW68640.1 lipid-A-disaccharide synthase [Desulfosudis oleivorans Hxd3]